MYFGREIFEPPAGELFTLGRGTFFSCGQIEFWLPRLSKKQQHCSQIMNRLSWL